MWLEKHIENVINENCLTRSKEATDVVQGDQTTAGDMRLNNLYTESTRD